MRKLSLSLIGFILTYSTVVNATVFGGSNLGFSGYPEFSDSEPTPPYNRDEYSMGAYKRDVEMFIQNAKDYTENADNDVKRIREAQEDAIQKANRVVEEYNRTARGY
ncbi:hypothetical protein [Citrobacter koseri]|uniref:hypothetical protein n=1 Tax=Citrobacter koseri TaxID=545 RepID=UPI001FCC2185|nr:hypothetical protein [Citrobacter koseri]MDM9068046.1 hypothetical protein [Citrobacter koseri]MDM9082293.1 hypothetical protein [Citrobacter koseri]MDM9090288.1 hypothetical protein [Citrobacter koseri]MDM9097002.1 hypothetical protein [Citrobacter koseri]MDM9270527.1 hypothetical protein [Citrobacter koseri]